MNERGEAVLGLTANGATMMTASIAMLSVLLAGSHGDAIVPTSDPAPLNRALLLLELPRFERDPPAESLPPPRTMLSFVLEHQVTPEVYIVGTGNCSAATAPSIVLEADQFKDVTRFSAAVSVGGGVRRVLATMGLASASVQGIVGVDGSWTESLSDVSDINTGRYSDLLLRGSLHATATAIVDVELLPLVSLRLSADLLRAQLDGSLVSLPDFAASLITLDAARVGFAVAF